MRLLTLLILGAMAVGCAQTQKGKDAAAATATKADTKKVAPGAANKEGLAKVEKVECKSGSDVRTLEVNAKDGNFEVVYTKFGEAKSIATGGRVHCEAIRDRVKGNLVNAGYTCS